MSLKKTFGNALRGLWIYISGESNNRIHLPAAALVIAAGIIFNINPLEWLFLFFSIGLVLTTEAFNFTVEKLCDEIQSEYSERIRMVKDISAGAVLIAVIISVIIGLIIFLPKVIDLFF
ncbi:MAG: diacylglycerol kinase family protein [Bacteroidota bacterium]